MFPKYTDKEKEKIIAQALETELKPSRLHAAKVFPYLARAYYAGKLIGYTVECKLTVHIFDFND